MKYSFWIMIATIVILKLVLNRIKTPLTDDDTLRKTFYSKIEFEKPHSRLKNVNSPRSKLKSEFGESTDYSGGYDALFAQVANFAVQFKKRSISDSEKGWI